MIVNLVEPQPGLAGRRIGAGRLRQCFRWFSHIGLCIGNGWVAGQSAVEELDSTPAPHVNPEAVRKLYSESLQPLNSAAQSESDRVLRELQKIMFAHDIGILKHADRLELACRK